MIDIEQCFIKHVNETRASFAKIKSEHEVEIGSIKSENVKTSQTITEEIKSVKGEIIDMFSKDIKEVKEAVQKVERLDKDVKSMKKEISMVKSQNRCLLLISIGLGLLLVATTDFFPFDAAAASEAILTRLRLSWLWFQRGCF